MKQPIAKYILVLVVACFVFSSQVFGQVTPPPPPPAPPNVPIDGGVVGLLLVGLGYGARKLYLQNHAEEAGK
jgi:hypothetical protein